MMMFSSVVRFFIGGFALVSLVSSTEGFSKLVQVRWSWINQIACSRNPAFSFCDDGRSESATIVTTTQTEDVTNNKDKVHLLRDTANITFLEFDKLPDLPTIQQHIVQVTQNLTNSKTPEKLSSKVEGDNLTETLVNSPADTIINEKKTKFLSAEADAVITDNDDSEEILDDPIFDKPFPSKNYSNSEWGSLLRLPKPQRKKNRHLTVASMIATPLRSQTEFIEPPPLPHEIAPEEKPAPANLKGNVPPGYIEVYITKYCVEYRKDFLNKCRSPKIAKTDVDFCKSYPFDCTSDEDNVVPLLAYCERFLHDYVRVCAPTTKRDHRGRQFCKAYDQFCVPPPTRIDIIESTQALTRCEVIQPEARKVCNPPPPPSDRLNYARCSQFRQFCAKYIDWE